MATCSSCNTELCSILKEPKIYKTNKEIIDNLICNLCNKCYKQRSNNKKGQVVWAKKGLPLKTIKKLLEDCNYVCKQCNTGMTTYSARYVKMHDIGLVCDSCVIF